MEKNTVLLQDTEAFMHGELDNVTVQQNCIVLDLVQGGYVPYGCYTSAPIPMPLFDALRVSWNAASPEDTAVEAQVRVMVDGKDVARLRRGKVPFLRRQMGIIFQDFRLIEKKTVYENLGFAMRAVGSSPREIKKRIPYVLELVGLEEKTDRYPNELSGGEQQRVAIARALINNPSTIIADEPTGNLDPARSLEIMRLLERINQLGTTMVVVTHEKDLVNQFKKRVVTLEQGVITSDGDGVGYNAR